MTTFLRTYLYNILLVVEAYRLGRYDNLSSVPVNAQSLVVVEAYRLGRYDNFR